ncbi:MAG: hypothetical protein AAGC67_02970 [Myxococcota bacterium]
MRLFHSSVRLFGSASLVLLLVLASGPTLAGGVVGDHVKDLEGNLGNYEKEIGWLIGQVDGIVADYAKGGTQAAKSDRLIEIWEEVDFHAAIETNYIPIYASIWQGLFGVKTAIDEAAPLERVADEQAKLEQAFWQALGAVKMAALHQKTQAATASDSAGGPETPIEVLLEVERRLDRVVAKYAERLSDEATSIVYETYQTRFEGVEGELIERDAELVSSLEIDFNVTLPEAIKKGGTVEEVRRVVEAMQAKLEKARGLLAESKKPRKSVF